MSKMIQKTLKNRFALFALFALWGMKVQKVQKVQSKNLHIVPSIRTLIPIEANNLNFLDNFGTFWTNTTHCNCCL